MSAVIPDHVRVLTEGDSLQGAGAQEIGDHWLASSSSAVLRVHSAVILDEFNFLLNPRHPEFIKITSESPVPFVFDERLFHTK